MVMPHVGNSKYRLKKCSHGYPVVRHPKRDEPHLDSDGNFCSGSEKTCATWKLPKGLVDDYFILEPVI